MREVFSSKVEFHKTSRFMWTNHLFHKYNWCHVIDTTPQLDMTVGLGIKLKSMSVRSWRWTSLRLPRNPHIAARVLLNRANLSFVLICHDRCIWLPAFFSYFLCQSFVDSVAFWCHPSLVVKTWAWMKTSQCQSLLGCTHPFLFQVVGRSLLGTSRNMTVK